MLPDGTKIFVDAIPLPVFYDTANEVGKIITFIKSTNTKILFCLFDRGYYSSAVIKELKKQKVRYLMLVPKTSGIKKILEENSETIFVKKEYMVNGKISTNIIVVRDERFDWTFATNLRFHNLMNAIWTYKIRWNIETGFRVTDEARIKSKSKNIVIRYFLFLCSFVMYNIWKLQYSNKMSFNRFMSTLSNQIIGEKYFWIGFIYCMAYCRGFNWQLPA